MKPLSPRNILNALLFPILLLPAMPFIIIIGKRWKVPLADIKKIQRSDEGIKVKGLSSWRYTIEFHRRTKMADQSIYELIGSGTVEEFVSVVKQKNPTVNVLIGSKPEL